MGKAKSQYRIVFQCRDKEQVFGVDFVNAWDSAEAKWDYELKHPTKKAVAVVKETKNND